MKKIYEPELELTSYKSLIKYIVLTVFLIIILEFRSYLYKLLHIQGALLSAVKTMGNILFVMAVASLYLIVIELVYTTINRNNRVNRKKGNVNSKAKNMKIWISFALIALSIFFIQSHYRHIDKSEAIKIIAHFDKYVRTTGHTSLRYISFTDYGDLKVLTDNNSLNTVKQGSELIVLKSPIYNIALAVYELDHTVIEYDTSLQAIDLQRKGWMVTISIIYLLYMGCFFLIKRHE
ncbi:MAG: hypothetical protein K6A72_10190 [Lachnospiraceae bacterium]|nr:hypothetical protein [Lachnospiraceae bacterium]